jgi:pimeloyl-ACP methyl ester carboxylesterase
MGDPSKPALLLIHGFGASAYHFRNNIPTLARNHHVFAFDMLGFGLSSKPIIDYSAEIWRDQAVDFVTQVIGKPTTISGNSLGGFTALFAAATEQNLIQGCILLNAAGRFRDPNDNNDAPIQMKDETNDLLKKLMAGIQRAVIGFSFLYTKQPARIQQVLKQVYPVNPEYVDAELVESIRIPSLDPNAAEVFYRVISSNGSGPSVFVDDLLEKMQCPLLLCWGEQDPWIRPAAADRIQALYPMAKRVSIDAGHCPHDEHPEAVNAAIFDFIQELT